MTAADEIVELLGRLVACPSHETEEGVQRLLGEEFESAGFHCTTEEVAPGRHNLVARRGRAGPLLCSHADVHPPHRHPEPWTLRHEGELLVGRGALDAKGQLAALVCACRRTGGDALVLVCADEEGGGRGSEHAKLPDGPWLEEGGVVLEPTAFAVCTAQAGHVDLLLECFGEPGHAYAGTLPTPVDVVVDAVAAVRSCALLEARHPLLPPPRLVVGRVEGGEHPWRRPARARAFLTATVTPPARAGEAAAEVRRVLDPVATRARREGLTFSVEITDGSDPFELDPGLAIVGALQRAAGEPLPIAGMPSWTDAETLLHRHGIPCVVFGAGDLASAHSDFEGVRLADLVRLSEVIARLVDSP